LRLSGHYRIFRILQTGTLISVMTHAADVLRPEILAAPRDRAR
jgi:hypothetical protein